MKKYVEKDGQTFAVEVMYSKGGISYFTGKHEARGYYLNVRPVTLEKGDGYTSESFMIFSGYKHLLKEVKRKSDKTYRDCLEMYEHMVEPMMDKILSERLTDEA